MCIRDRVNLAAHTVAAGFQLLCGAGADKADTGCEMCIRDRPCAE